MLFYDMVKNNLEDLEADMVKVIPKDPSEVYDLIMPYVRRGGKRIRPILSFLSFLACKGGKDNKIIRPVAILELFHNFTLIHDDIEDNSEMRRGEPTLHKLCGIPMALNSGDAMYTCIWKSIAELKLPQEEKSHLSSLYADSFKRVVEGQGIELYWHFTGRFDVSEEDYIYMIRGKTAALLGLSCELGGYLAGNRNHLKALRNFGEFLGISFQIQDDILNVTGRFDKYKKEIGGDISEGKRTLMVVYALNRASPPNIEKLKSILQSNSKNKEHIKEVITILTESGAVDYAREKAEEFKRKALSSLASLPDSKEKEALVELANYVLTREE